MTDSHPAAGCEFDERAPVKTLRDDIAIASLTGLIMAGFDAKLIPDNAYMLADRMIAKMKEGK